MAVLITGGCGFVGINAAEHLLGRGEDVVLFGPAPPPPAALAALQRAPGRLHVVAGDVSIAADLDAALDKHAVDRVIHGAAITADIHREKRAARDIFMVNLIGTVELLEAAVRHQVRRVVQLGTGSIFGGAGRAADILDEQTSGAYRKRSTASASSPPSAPACATARPAVSTSAWCAWAWCSAAGNTTPACATL